MIRTLIAVGGEEGSAIAGAFGDLARYQVVGQVATNDETCDAVARLRPDVVILDSELAEQPTLPAIARLLESSPATKVVVYTADTHTALRDEAEAAGARAIVGKRDPFGWLLRTVDNVVPELAGTRRADDTASFGDRMRILLEQEDARSPITSQWWRQRGVRPWLIAASIALAPLLAMLAWIIAELAGFSR